MISSATGASTAPWALRLLAGAFAPRGDPHSLAAVGRLPAELSIDGAVRTGRVVACSSGEYARGEVEDVVCLVQGRPELNRLTAALGNDPRATPEEVLAAGWRRFGEGVLELLRGPFALLLWDEREGRGVLAEDPLGGRSIYLAEHAGALLFATELPPLLRLLPMRPAPDPHVLVQWLATLEMPIGRTLFSGVSRLGDGHCVSLGRGGWSVRRYWRPRYQGVFAVGPSEADELIADQLVRSVARAAGTANTLGVTVSGGLDSSSVAAVAASLDTGARLSAYTAAFPEDPEIDESVYVGALNKRLGIQCTFMTPEGRGALANALDWQNAWGQPLRAPGLLIERPLLQQAFADGIRTVLDGQGGDELFGLSPYLLADRVRRGRVLSAWRLAGSFPHVAASPAPWKSRAIMRAYGLGGALPWRIHRALLRSRGTSGDQRLWLTPGGEALFLEADSRLDWKRDYPGPRWWAFLAHLLTEGRTIDTMPEMQHRRALLDGLDARSPLLDLDLVELVLKLPPELAFDGALDRPRLRSAMAGRLPDEVRLRSGKSSYAAFIHRSLLRWELGAIQKVLDGAEVCRYVQPGAIEQLLAHPPDVGEAGWHMWAPRIWSLVTAECWLRYQAGGQSQAPLREELSRPSARVVAS